MPLLVKDNLDSYDMQTTAGALALTNSIPGDDATVVDRLRKAGAIILGKSNMMELGVFATESRSSIRGSTVNAYDATRSSLGSSGGSAVAVSADLCLLAVGTDTNSSIVAPSAANNVVGLRPTFGLASRDGVVTGLDETTVPGPIARTVEDVARMLSVIAGEDGRDPSTTKAQVHEYLQLDSEALEGARLGALRDLIDSSRFGDDESPTSEDARTLIARAFASLRDEGASVQDVQLADIATQVTPLLARRNEDLPFKFHIDRYLATLPADAPIHSLHEMVASGGLLPDVPPLAEAVDQITVPPEQSAAQADFARGRNLLAEQLVKRMDGQQLDALVYLTLAQPAQPLDQPDDPYGVAGQLSAFSGLPSITVPIGFTREGLPLGMTLLARPFAEATLLELAHAFEVHTHHRRAPSL